MKYRIEVTGSNSIWTDSYPKAIELANLIIGRNGFGYIHEVGDGPSRMVAKFDPSTGVITN